MWWRVLTGALGLGLLIVLAGGPRPITTTKDRAVVIATLPCATNLQTTSSGFVVDDQTVVTVAHAIYESRDFAVQDRFGDWHPATVEHLDLQHDLAVVHIEDLAATPMPRRVADRGDDVYMLDGAASGTIPGEVSRRVRLTTALVGDLSQTSQRRGYELAMASKGGDSGSAVVDGVGNLVGVVFARSTTLESVTWATSTSEIETALDGHDVPEWECELDLDHPLVLPGGARGGSASG